MHRWLPFRHAPARPAPREPAPARAGTPAAAAPADRAAEAAAPSAPANAAWLAWLLDCPPPATAEGMGEVDRAALSQLDALAGRAELPASLLSRAPAVIPQLLRLLRQDDAPLTAMAQRISLDPVLTAEVMRLSRSAFYRTPSPVTDIEHALALLGRNGLQMAIASVVLKPLFDAPSGSLSRRAAPRLWEHSTVKARHCALLAAQGGQDTFEAYLAGLLHNTGWTVMLRALDACAGIAAPIGAPLAHELARRAHLFFAKAVGPWRITSTLCSLCEQLARQDAAGTAAPIAVLLLRADAAATRELLGAAVVGTS